MAKQPADRRLDELVELLAKNATVVLSGTRLASQLRVPPSTLWDWMERLRGLGLEIRGLPGTGYQLVKLPDVLTPQAVRRSLHQGQFGCRIAHFYRTDSTMTEAERLADKGAPHGTVVIAEEQTAGRGRFGRQWFSERAAGIYFTLLLRPPLAPAAAPILTLVAGIALAETIREISQLPTDLRWPNDALIRDRKCAGVLVEMTAEPERIDRVLMGVGINVNHSEMPEDLAAEATSLRLETGRAFSRLEILAVALKRLEQYYLRLLEHGPAVIVRRFSELSSFARGKRVKVTDGARVLIGETAGLSPEGVLIVRRDDGRTEAVLGGQVRAE